MSARALAGVAFAVAALAASPAHAGDPYVHWYTIHTPHFRVHFHAGVEQVAEKAANVAEDVYDRLTPTLGFIPSGGTDLVITDESNDANGFATTLPYNHIVLFVTAPDDMSGLGDYDDWVTELVTHEFTHILHTGNVSGAPAVVNGVLGPTLHPNQEQPHWIIEGLAVAMETAHTTGGRLRSTQFDMLLRADVLAGNLARLDEISNVPRRWPGANLWYLYGANFVAWIASIYGSDIFAAVATDYGASLIPYGVNRAIRRATGRTYSELYEGFRADLTREVLAEKARVESIGLREGRRLTFEGFTALGPRFLPPSCGAGRALAYHRAGPDEPGGVYRLSLDAPSSAVREELVAAASGRSVAFMPDCSLVFDHAAPTHRQYFFSDVFRQPPGTRSPHGYDKNRERLTFGRRAREPDVSADGRHIAYVTNRGGTSTLRLAELSPSGRVTHERRLAPSAFAEQAFTPRFSPDGSKVAYGVWTDGGYRDLRLVDVRTSQVVELWHDRALDQQPAWSPDGKTLYFTSDRSGIANVYAYDLETGALHQVTNVLTGAYMPEPSPDGRSLVYVGYTTDGFDLYELALDRARWLPVTGPVSERLTPRGRPLPRHFPVVPYNPLPSLQPRNWGFRYGKGSFGNALTLTTSGADAIGRHSVSAELTFESEHLEPQGSLDYFYARLPFGFRATAFRSAAPRKDYRIGETTQTVTEHHTGATTGVVFGMPGDAEIADIALSYTLAHFDHERPLGSRLDPFAPVPVEPDSGFIGIVRVGYDYSNASATPNAISLERGFRIAVASDLADPAWGSESTLTAFSGVFSAYLPMPWAAHHVLALGLSGAIAMGSYARIGPYYTGGFADLQAFDVFTTGIRQEGFVLRGYDPGQYSGSQYNLLNLEYRFPLLYVDRGLSTLPVFLRRLSGILFMDWGGAYYEMDLEHPLDVYEVGIGGELWINLALGYNGTVDIRLGLAKGLDSTAPRGAGPFGMQTYLTAGSAF